MNLERLLVVATIGLAISAPCVAQIVRSPSMNLEFHRAQAAWKSGGSLLEAKARLDRVIEAGPEDGEALLLRAQVEMAMKHFDRALADARRAVDLDPEGGDANLVLCQAARLAGATEEAVGALQSAVSEIEPDPRKHIVLSMEAMLLGQYETSESLARVAVALDGSNPEAHYQLARVLALRGMKDSSVLILTRGLADGSLSAEYVAGDAVFDTTGVARAVLAGD